MKKKLLLLVLCLLFTFAACGDDAPLPTEPTVAEEEVTLQTLAGWWTKPDSFEGVTSLLTFSVDPESETITSYDAYGNVVAEYPCWYDEAGFSIEADDFFGTVIYQLVEDTLVDEDGAVHYVRRDPMEPGENDYTVEDLMGTWYKNGQKDATKLMLEAGTYRMETSGVDLGGGNWKITLFASDNGDFVYNGYSVEMDPPAGMSAPNLWILEDGDVLYDSFFEIYYVKEGADTTHLCQKYDLVRDGWYTSKDEYMLKFSFNGQLWLLEIKDSAQAEAMGSWELKDGTLYLVFQDGTTQEMEVADALHIESYDMTFHRFPAW